MNTKINAVQANIADLRKDIKKLFGQAHLRELRQHFSRVTGLCTDAKAVASLNDPEKEWIEIGRRFSDERAYFFGEVKHLLEQETIDTKLFTSFLTSFSICSAGRIECLLLAGETATAVRTAEDIAEEYGVLDLIDPVAVHVRTEWMRMLVVTLFLRLETLKTRRLQDLILLKMLRANNIDSRDYVQAIRRQKEHPIVILSCEQ